MLIRVLTAFLLFLAFTCPGQYIHVPADYGTIQEGIDAAGEGNTVLVAPGTYYENITVDKNITLASHYKVTGDTSYISSTIIDGGENGRVITIGSGLDSATLVTGFSITNGQNNSQGGGILIGAYADPVLDHLRVFGNAAQYGGGLFMASSEAQIKECSFSGNTANNKGGGVCIQSWNYWDEMKLVNVLIENNHAPWGGGLATCDVSNPVLSGVTIRNNTADLGGGISMEAYSSFDSVNRCNIYMNAAGLGADLWRQDDWVQPIIVDTFTVMYPTEFHAHHPGNFSFNILNGKFNQVEEDLYVSPSGDNENSGLTPADPLKTIFHALTIIVPDSLIRRKVYLLDGTYSQQENSEFFPVNLIDHIDLSGTADNLVILDADSLSRVMHLYGNDSNMISGLTLAGGSHQHGGGIFISNSAPLLEGLTIRDNSSVNGAGVYNAGTPTIMNCSVINNSATGNGGGIFSADTAWIFHTSISGNEATEGGGIYNAGGCYLELDSAGIVNNHAAEQGGGICCLSGSLTRLDQSTVSHNSAGYSGGGVYCYDESMQELAGSWITYNTAEFHGGGIYNPTPYTVFDSISQSSIYLNEAAAGNDLYHYYGDYVTHVIADTFTVMHPTDFHAYKRGSFTFDILAGKYDQVDADLYVSPDGSGENTGLTPDDPLKTIRQAYQRLRADRDHQNTVHLANGIYSDSTTGERFPVGMVDFSSLSGENRSLTILDAAGQSNVLSLHNDSIPEISDLTLRRGGQGNGGIFCLESDVTLDNVIIEECTGSNSGGGIYFGAYGNLVLLNSVIRNNNAERGGGLCMNNASNAIIKNTVFESNSADIGGGIFSYSDLDLRQVEFINNSAMTGGGVALQGISSTLNVLMEGTRFIANMAGETGGGLYSIHCNELTMVNCVIDSNSAIKGGGLWLENSTTALRNSLVTNNTGSQQWGGAAFYRNNNTQDYPDAEIHNVTFTGNKNFGLLCYRTGANIVNSLFRDDSSQYQVQFTLRAYDQDTLRITNSNLKDGMDGILLSGPTVVEWSPTNIDEDPLFLLSGDHPYSLLAGSPCIDAGTPDTTGLNLPLNDIMGNTRVWDGDGDGLHVIDMGPYEYGAPVSVPEEIPPAEHLSGDIYCYPNPANDQLTVITKGNLSTAKISFINTLGIVVLTAELQKSRSELTLNIQHLSPGIYTLLVMDERKVLATGKVLVLP